MHECAQVHAQPSALVRAHAHPFTAARTRASARLKAATPEPGSALRCLTCVATPEPQRCACCARVPQLPETAGLSLENADAAFSLLRAGVTAPRTPHAEARAHAAVFLPPPPTRALLHSIDLFGIGT
eukprot:5238325-Pleurochrysis_carterae.AAC.2